MLTLWAKPKIMACANAAKHQQHRERKRTISQFTF